MTNHTKGPWVIDGQDISPADDDRLSICVIEPVDDVEGRWRHGEETGANASLIASAPELLEALVLAVDAEPNCPAWLYVARAAIAKARGEA